jgi:hypothetical protein
VTCFSLLLTYMIFYLLWVNFEIGLIEDV